MKEEDKRALIELAYNAGFWDAMVTANQVAASEARNCSHTCMTEKHCDFLHAAHRKLAEHFEERVAAAKKEFDAINAKLKEATDRGDLPADPG